jgi:predicted dehydrogenase
MSTSNLLRRRFLQSAAAALAAPSFASAADPTNIAIIGLGGRGGNHIDGFASLPDARIVAVCDVDQAARERAVARVQRLQGHNPRAYDDMRRVFDDREVQAVTIATPNHWHALGAVWACQAGKDVYVEKPACHNVWEGFQLVAASRKYNRMVMVGSQSRSASNKIEAIKALRDGVIGKVYLAKGLCYKRRKSIGHTPDEPVPAGLDWSQFLGPAQMKPYSKNKFHYNWHWFWDTGNGDIGNQGVHEMDIARWGLGKTGLPKSVVATGGKFAYIDDQETPNTESAVFDYGDCQLAFEVRGLITNAEEDVMVGNLFYGAEGYLAVDWQGYRIYKGEKKEKVADVKVSPEQQYTAVPHFANFIQAVRSRDAKYLTADAQTGVVSASLCHLANISYRLGRKLTFDPDTRRFAGDADANRMLTRDYRKPFVVPESV